MKERRKQILTGFLLVVFICLGVFEYMQLMYSFDIPQVMLLMPMVGALSFIVLQKKAFIVPAGTIVLSCIYQIVAGEANAVAYLQTGASGIARVILYVLPVCILFQLLGIGAGALIRVLINGNKKRAVGVLCLVLGILLATGPYLAIYHNPLYPILSRVKLGQYVNETCSDYKISEKKYYFDLNTSTYQCRVVMADGVIRTVFFEPDGTISRGS